MKSALLLQKRKLAHKDSNLDYKYQKLGCYRYTMGQSAVIPFLDGLLATVQDEQLEEVRPALP